MRSAISRMVSRFGPAVAVHEVLGGGGQGQQQGPGPGQMAESQVGMVSSYLNPSQFG